MPRYIDAEKFKNGVMAAMTEKSAKDGALPMYIGILLCHFADDTPTEDVMPVQHDEQRNYVYECPVKPGQKVYFARYNGTTEDEVICVSFYEDNGEIKWEACTEVGEYFGNGSGMPTQWNEEVFHTREEAEKEVTKNCDQ